MDIPTKAIHNTAHFSDCGLYRYNLIRRFAQGNGIINFIMLNPSTANEEFNDPTVARCEQRAINGGYEKMIVTNIFAYRATDPQDMISQEDPIGELNDFSIINEAKKADLVVCAWGEISKHMKRGEKVRKLLLINNIKANALKINKSGEPAHPLYLSMSLEPVRYDLQNKISIKKEKITL